MILNNAKSHMVALFGDGGETSADSNATFNINGQQPRRLWPYLRIEFSAKKRHHQSLASLLSLNLQHFAKAPLKPQQRLYTLQTPALPELYYNMMFRRTRVNELIRGDRVVRLKIRQRLAVPRNTPTGYFHAPVEEEELEISSIDYHWTVRRGGRSPGCWPRVELEMSSTGVDMRI